jgi:diguanylate cyclase (GGDEF)-like protein
MENIKHNIESNAKLLKTQVSRYAILGLIMAVTTILVASMAASYQMTGNISFDGMIYAQRNNVALWILNLTPIVFMFWGQSISSVMSYKAGAMILDQTNELRLQTSELESKVLFETSHDTLTELPNRILFVDRLNQGINALRHGEEKKLAVLMMNINNFRDINTGFGQFNADRLLKQFAQRIKNTVPENCTVARLSGDEFAILLPSLEEESDVVDLINKIKKAVSIYFVLDGVVIDVNATIGVAVCPTNGNDADTLIQRANVAIFNARQSGKDYALYNPSMDKGNPNKLILMSELKRAIESEQLLVYFQPKVDLINGTIIGAEALVRWEHPSFGFMNAEKFIPVAERTGLVKTLTSYVLKEVISQAAKWNKMGYTIDVAVNLSTVDIVDIELPYTIESLLNVHELEPKQLKVEIIESAYLTDQKNAIEVINRLSDLGIKIAIDDFGTGYSSFVYLTDLPIDEIKIDKSFVMSVAEDSKKKNIVHAMIKLAEALEIVVVAEGVCDKNVFESLKELNCTVGQGFYFSEAVKADDFLNLINKQQQKKEANSS